MNTFDIHEGRIERLEKKLQNINNKCKKLGQPFTYERVGEVVKQCVNPDTGKFEAQKFITVKVEGNPKIVGQWELVGKVEFRPEVNKVSFLGYKMSFESIPNRYWKGSLVCEHCGNRRVRKVFLVHNVDTDEFKSVGSSCLLEFTGGLNAELIASYMSVYETMFNEDPYLFMPSQPRYYEIGSLLRCYIATVDAFGYRNSSEYADTSTKARGFDYWKVLNDEIKSEKFATQLRDEMTAMEFNINRPEVDEEARDAICWIRSQKIENTYENEYMTKLQAVCMLTHVKASDLGLLASLVPTYRRHLRDEVKKAYEEQREKELATSEYVGEEGQRIDIKVKSMQLVSSWDGYYGYTYLYEIIDINGNVFKWFSSCAICYKDGTFFDFEKNPVTSVRGTVKKHQEYQGVKETVLTRCVIEYQMPEAS